MRRSLPVIAVIATLVILSGCTGALGTGDSSSTAPTTINRTVEVAGSGAVDAQPNQAVVRLGVRTSGSDAATARQRLAENVTQLRDALSEIEGAQVTTSGYDIGQDHRRSRENPDAEPTYVARQTFEVTINDTDNAGTVIDTAVQNGANDVDDVRFTISGERRDELEEQALQNAVDRARTKADTIADRANLTVTGVRAVTTVERGYRPYEAQATAAAGDGGSTTIESGPVTVTAQVQVTYEAEET